MKQIFSTILLGTALVAFASPSLQLDRERIESGKTFGLQLIVPIQEIPESRGALQMNAQNGFTVLSVDSVDKVIRPDFDDMFSSFFGGGRNRGGYKARVYNFTMKAPRQTGKIDAGSITWEIDGEKQTIAHKIPISIQRAYTDDAVVVSLTPNKKTVYEGEQFSVTLGFHTYEHFAGGLQAKSMDLGHEFIVHRADLSEIQFKPVPGTRENTAEAKFAWLSPTKSGELTVPAFTFSYTKVGEPKVVETKKQMGGMSFTSQSVTQEREEAEAKTPTLKINVKPLPTEGRPENFSGMVGNYSFNADFDKTNLKVGEALTLSITIKGDGTPGTIGAPRLPTFDDFRSVPPEENISKKVVGGKVVTTKEIRIFLYPKKKGSFTIPEISYSWFNPSKKLYETAKAGPWNIEVEKGDNTSEMVFQAPAAAGPTAVQKQAIESLGSDIRFIHNVSDKATDSAPYKSILFWIVFVAAVPLYFIAAFLILRKRKRSSDSALMRRGKANKMLKSRFAAAGAALHNKNTKAFYAALENGLVDYISDLTNTEFRGMTRPQMKQELASRGINEITITAIDGWFEKCAFARFAPVTPSTNEQMQMLKDVEQLCEKLGNLE